MKKIWKRLAAIMITLSMAMGLLPANVTAAEIEEPELESALQDNSEVSMFPIW